MNKEKIIIPEGINEIFNGQFQLDKIKEIKLPKSLRVIDKEAFCGCHLLETIEIPEGVTDIKNAAFKECSNLKKIILPKSLKSIGKEAFSNCSSLETIEIPEGVTEIKAKTFANCEKLIKVKLPDGITQIGTQAFDNCPNLKKINLPDSLQNIDYEAFSFCGSIEEINMPDSVTDIGKLPFEAMFYYLNDNGYCFYRCTKLKQVKLSNNIEIIPQYCFYYCKRLEKVILSSELKIIEKEAFRDCILLKNIVFPNGVQEIRFDAFRNCEKLKEIVIPSSVIKIDSHAFEGSNIKDITINYETFESLASFIKENKDFFEKNPHASVCFAGSKLGFKEKVRIKQYLENKVSFKEGQVPIIMPEYNPINMTNLDDDIKKIIDDINEICSKLPKKNKEEIINQINELLDEYNSNKEKYKPKFDFEEKITLNIGSINLLKPRLLSSLNMIKLNLASEKKLIKFLSELEKYKKLLTEDINELSNNNSIEEIIKNIIYYSKFIDEDKKNEYLTKLKEYIDIEIKKSNNKISKNNKKEIELNTKYEQDYEEEFRLNVLRLYDDISAYASKIFPYIKLLNTITTKEEIDKPNLDDNTLTGLINGIKYIINNLSDSRYQEELEEKLKEITNKYSKIIEELLKEPNNLNQPKYEDLEHKIREDLQPLLEQIRSYITLEEYENTNANNTNLLNQLYTCKDIIEAKEKVTPTKEQNREVLTSTIIEINNDLLYITVLDNISKDTIREELSNIIDRYIRRLNKNLIYNLKEYNIVTREILTEFIDIQLKVERYIKEVKEYKKYVK